MEISERISNSLHSIHAEHFEEHITGKNWLKVSISFTDKVGQPSRICSETWIQKALLEAGTLYRDAGAWKEEQVPKLTEKVLKRLYAEKRKGNVWKR